jgi:hypothetical protein
MNMHLDLDLELATVQMKNDFVIEHDEMVAYESLIRTVQMAKYAPVA